MFERPASGERAVLVQLDLNQGAIEERLSELELLTLSAGASVEAVVQGKRAAPDPKLFAGSGKVQEIGEALRAHGADIVIFNHALSPGQQRNLERELQCMVIDRTALILDIFAQRARSHEGKLQVELAKLQYLATRLVRRWSHLERQKGGHGLRGGPGETQIELDRRMIDQRIKSVKERLIKVKRQRGTQRRARERRGTFRISLVGYTNAGKSTLFNAMVKARSYAADQLFATLDTTVRQLYLEDAGCSVSLSDTVGFIRDLPHGLVEAFQATLQEAADADLLLHVVDAASPNRLEQIEEVMRVLQEIDAAGIRQMLVFNKLDALEDDARPRVMVDRFEIEPGRSIERLHVSARSGEGLAQLRERLAAIVLEADEPSPPAEHDPRFDRDGTIAPDWRSDPEDHFQPAPDAA